MLRAAPKNRLGRWSVGVHATRQHFARGRDDGVVGARETSDGIEQDDDVLLVLHQALGLFDHHLGDLHVPAGRLVEGRGDHLAAYRALHLGHFLRALVDEQHDEHDIRMVAGDGVGDVLQHHGLAGLGRRHHQTALALADRRNQIDHARRHVLARGVVALELHALLRVQRRQVLEQDLVLGLLGRLEVDLVDLEQREVALGFLGWADVALDGVAGAQVEAADLRG